MSTQVSLRPVPVAGLCGPGVTCFPAGIPPGVCGQVRPVGATLPTAARRAPSHEAADGYTCPQARAGSGRMGTLAALTTILYVYDTPDNNRTRTIVYC